MSIIKDKYNFDEAETYMGWYAYIIDTTRERVGRKLITDEQVENACCEIAYYLSNHEYISRNELKKILSEAFREVKEVSNHETKL